MNVRLLVKSAELQIQKERLQQRDHSLQEKIYELECKQRHIVSTEERLQKLQVCWPSMVL